MKGIEWAELAAVEKHSHWLFSSLAAEEEAVKHELEMCCGFVELSHEILPITVTIRTDEAIELLPHHQRAVRDQTFGPRYIGRVAWKLDYPLVAHRNCIEIPDRTGHLASLACGHGQSTTLRERRRLESETEPAKIGYGTVFERTPASRAHRFQELHFRHAGAVVKDPEHRRFRMRVAEQIYPAGSRSQRVVDDIGHGSLQRIADVAQALNEDRCPGRNLLFSCNFLDHHVSYMATRRIAVRGRHAFGWKMSMSDDASECRCGHDGP